MRTRRVSQTCLKRPVFTAAVTCAVAFFVLLVLLIAAMNWWPYYLNHLVVALLIFIFASGLHHVVVHYFKWTDGNWLMGLASSLPFYVSREIRDREKLGYWDWPGVLWPTIGILVLAVLLELGSYLWRRHKRMSKGAVKVPVVPVVVLPL